MNFEKLQFEKALKKFKRIRTHTSTPFGIARLKWIEKTTHNDPYDGVTIVSYDESNCLEWDSYRTMMLNDKPWQPTQEDIMANDWVIISIRDHEYSIKGEMKE